MHASSPDFAASGWLSGHPEMHAMIGMQIANHCMHGAEHRDWLLCHLFGASFKLGAPHSAVYKHSLAGHFLCKQSCACVGSLVSACELWIHPTLEQPSGLVLQDEE